MGVPLGGSSDSANPKVTGTITAAALVSQGVAASPGSSAAEAFRGTFNVAMWGTFSGTVLLEKTFDGGTTWITVSQDAAGTAASYVLAWTAQSMGLLMTEVETQVAWRLRCSAFTSGTLNYRLSQGGGLFFTDYPGAGGRV